MMKLTILGSGTCVPSGARNSSGYFVEANHCLIRLDAGAGTLHAMGRYHLPWEDITHQWISHFHLDHINELSAFLFSLRYGRSRPRTKPLTLMGPVGLEALVRHLATLYQQKLVEQEFPLLFREVSPGETVALSDDVTLHAEKTPHTKESLSVKLSANQKTMVYTGDTAPSEELAQHFKEVDLLLCECSFLEGNHQTAHLAADDVSALAKEARVKHLVATHFYFDPEKDRLRERLGGTFTGVISIAQDGQQIEV
jgi:ribonuclease BN (tRNA processing enzyme)